MPILRTRSVEGTGNESNHVVVGEDGAGLSVSYNPPVVECDNPRCVLANDIHVMLDEDYCARHPPKPANQATNKIVFLIGTDPTCGLVQQNEFRIRTSRHRDIEKFSNALGYARHDR